MARPIFIAGIAIVTAAAMLQLGLFDWPSFKEATIEPTLYFFVASTTEKDIGANVERLLEGTKAAAEAVVSEEKLASPAAAYGAPEGAEMLHAGFYFDDPHATEKPRWGLGWAIDADDDRAARSILKKVSAHSELDEPIRLVKIGGGAKVIRGRIPWRSHLTPAISPMLHWGRAYNAYKEGGYESDNGRKDEESSVACEIYVTGPKDSMEYIDYVVLMGDTHEIFDGMFPPERFHLMPTAGVSSHSEEKHHETHTTTSDSSTTTVDMDAIEDTRAEPMDMIEETVLFE